MARAKPGAERERWLHGDATGLPPLQVDLAALRPGGHLVFEVRDPARETWRDWTRGRTWVRLEVPGAGTIEKVVPALEEVRDAPDRPGRELVFVARRRD